MKALAQVFDQIFKDPRHRALLIEGQVFTAWPRVVGLQVAQISRPVRFERGTLQIKVYSATWRNELSMISPDIIRKINERVGTNAVKKIIFR
ncbi:MAG TPA: DUF721 domain-containing protein [Bacteroidetes bacterium]|nr:DUF721 domain-containing protein [Bacteroidota bacterium]